MLFIREDVSSKLLSIENTPFVDFYIELNLRRKKWLLCASSNPDRDTIDSHLDEKFNQKFSFIFITI